MSWWTSAVPTGGFVSALKWLSGQSSTDIMLEPLQLFPSRMAHGKGSAQSTWAALKLHPQATSPAPVMTKLTGWDILFFVHFQFLTAYVIVIWSVFLLLWAFVCFSASHFQQAQNPPVISLVLVRKSFLDYYEEFLEKKGICYVPIRFHKDRNSNREESLEETIMYFLFLNAEI